MLRLNKYGGATRCFESLITEFTSILPYITATSADYLLFDLSNIIIVSHHNVRTGEDLKEYVTHSLQSCL